MLVISNRPRVSRSSDFEITRAISSQIVLGPITITYYYIAFHWYIITVVIELLLLSLSYWRLILTILSPLFVVLSSVFLSPWVYIVWLSATKMHQADRRMLPLLWNYLRVKTEADDFSGWPRKGTTDSVCHLLDGTGKRVQVSKAVADFYSVAVRIFAIFHF